MEARTGQNEEDIKAADARAKQAQASAAGAHARVDELGDRVSSLDDYDTLATSIVYFAVNKTKLTSAAMKDLDAIAQQAQAKAGAKPIPSDALRPLPRNAFTRKTSITRAKVENVRQQDDRPVGQGRRQTHGFLAAHWQLKVGAVSPGARGVIILSMSRARSGPHPRPLPEEEGEFDCITCHPGRAMIGSDD